jgi:hypothetical protein
MEFVMQNGNQDRIRQGAWGELVGRMAADPILITGRGSDRAPHAIANVIMNRSRQMPDGTSVMEHIPVTVSLFGPDALDFVEGSSERESVVCGDMVGFVRFRLDPDPRYHNRDVSTDSTAKGRPRKHIKYRKPSITITKHGESQGRETQSFNLFAIVSEGGWEILRKAHDSEEIDDQVPFVAAQILETPARVVARTEEVPNATMGAIMASLPKKSVKNKK